ncbi:MAG TPA: stalk domain-containing protein [bacterium]|nr:stalk domain-containing protein [bacterium]
MQRPIRAAVIVLIIGLAAALVPSPTALAVTPIEVLLNGNPIKFDVPPLIEAGRTLVPFRAIGEALGVQVHWDETNRRVIAEKGTSVIYLPIGNETACVNGQPTMLDVPAIINQGRTLVPLRFFSQAFGAQVHWDDNSRTVTIDSGGANDTKLRTAYILGYYYSHSYQDYKANHRSLSGVAAKWYTLDENCRLTWQDSRRAIAAPDGYEEVLEIAQASAGEVYALIFEDDTDKLHRLLTDPVQRELLSQDIVDLVTEEGFTGVNIDFEMITEADGPDFTIFIQELAQLIQGQGKKLALSLPARTDYGWYRGYDYAALGQAANQVAIMAYDYAPGQAGPQTSICWVRDVVDYTLKYISADKVLLGLGIYGRDWSASGRKTVLWCPSELGSLVHDLNDLISRYKPELKWDYKSMLPYFTYTDEQGHAHTVWYESIDSLKPKLELVREKGLAGVAVWRLGYTSPEFYQLLQAYFVRQQF